jgi:hypothetical protein
MVIEDSDTEDAWDIVVRAISKGKLLSRLGPLFGYVGALTSLLFLVSNPSDVVVLVYAIFSTIVWLLGGQTIGLFGLRGMMHGFETQKWVIDQDTEL